LGNSGDFGAGGRKRFGKVMAGGVAFDIAGQGEDDFVDVLGWDALDELGDAEIFGADAVERRDFSTEDVELAAVSAGLFDGENIDGTLDDAKERAITAEVLADFTWLFFGESAAGLAKLNLIAGTHQSVCQGSGDFRWSLD
jgi:hypothetical protein